MVSAVPNRLHSFSTLFPVALVSVLHHMGRMIANLE
jgi:hypothetical protein